MQTNLARWSIEYKSVPIESEALLCETLFHNVLITQISLNWRQKIMARSHWVYDAA